MADPEPRRAEVQDLFRSTRDPFPEPLQSKARQVAARMFGLDPSDLGPFKADDALGPYRIVSLLGVGGQAFVYEAEHTQLGRMVALKVPRQEVAERLLREARLAARLEHDHIIRMEDIREDPGPDGSPLPYLVMERCTGGNLEALLEEHPRGLPLDTIREVSSAVLQALDYAHSLGVVHRDVKPANVLFDEKGRVKLADFGIGALSTAGPDLAHSIERSQLTGGAVGTPLFWAPEQENPNLLSGDATIDGRADLFSFGKMLFLMLTGASPSTIRPASRLRAGLDPAWDEVIFKLLEEDRDLRHPRAADVQQELLDLLQARPRIKVSPSGSGEFALLAEKAPASPGEPEIRVRPRDTGAVAREIPPPISIQPHSTTTSNLLYLLCIASLAFGMVALLYGLQVRTMGTYRFLPAELATQEFALLGACGALGSILLWGIRNVAARTQTAGVSFLLALPICVWEPILFFMRAKGDLASNMRYLPHDRFVGLILAFAFMTLVYGLIANWSLRLLPSAQVPLRGGFMGTIHNIVRTLGVIAGVLVLAGCGILVGVTLVVVVLLVA